MQVECEDHIMMVYCSVHSQSQQ